MNPTLLRDFAGPGPEYRGKPFWAWNGKLEKDELIRQVHIIKEMGWGGFFMHSRTGLATEYLGDEWFEMINACADEAEKLGLEAWLYDEDRWPSGHAGGKVTQDPRYRMRYLRLRQVPAGEFAWSDDLIAAFACRLDGISYSDCRRLLRDTPLSEHAGLTVLAFTTEEMACTSFYNGQTYLDTLNREATERFLEVTHEQYRARCGDRLGRSIKGVFTDEPHRGLVMCSTGHVNSKPEWLVPWTPRLFDAFRERFGYDLTDHLPEIYLRPEGRRVTQVKWHFMEHLQQMFLDGFARPCDEWCRRHGLVLTGHVLHEDTLGAQAVPNGSMMRYYEYLEYPGIDLLTEGNRCFWVAKQVASVARQMGRRWVLSELYGCTGWQMPFEGHKAVGDWQSLFGVTLRCPHLSWYTMAGEAKRDFPASIFHQSAWYPEYERVETYFSRLQVAMSQGKPCCEVLVLNPAESVWCQIHSGWAVWLDTVAPEVRRLQEVYADLFHWLCGAQIDFDYGDEDHVSRFARVERNAGRPALHLGEMTYYTVIVAGMETIRSSTLDVLEAFVAAGGRVIMAGDPPAHVDAVPDDRARRLTAHATSVARDRTSLLAAVAASSPPVVTVLHGASGGPLTEVFCQARDTEDGRFILALNVNREQWFRNALLRIAGGGYVEEWNCLTGERHAIPAEQADGHLVVTTNFPPSGEHLYLVTPQPDRALPPKPTYVEVARSTCRGPFRYTLSEPNLLVLDRATFRLDDGEWREEREILRVDRAVRRELGLPLRGGEMLQPWFSEKQEHPVRAQLTLRFPFQVDELPTGQVGLVIETPEAFEVTVNGQCLSAEQVTGWWADRCLKRIPLPEGALKLGENLVELRGGFHEGVNLESLFLLGQFGVYVEGTTRTLTRLPEALGVGDVAPQGLPFYTARITYRLPVGSPPTEGARAFVSLPGFEAACVLVGRPGAEPKMIAWQPYEAEVTDPIGPDGELGLEVVLTRRNAFGPLHQVPLNATGYGPESFVGEGSSYTDEYMLYPSGLLRAPEIVWRRQV